MKRPDLFLYLILIIFTACSKNAPYQEEFIPDLNYTQPGIPAVNVKDFGAKGDGNANDDTAISMAMKMAHEKRIALFFPPGIYKTKLILLYDSLNIIGIKRKGRFVDYSGTLIRGLINCNSRKNITISDLNIDSRGQLLSSDDAAALNSGIVAGNQPLYHVFSNIALLGGGYNDYKHGILCQAGSGIQMDNIYVSAFYHGIAVRCSDVSINGISADYCGFTSIVIKSAETLNDLVQNVSVKNVAINGDTNDKYRRGGVVMVISYTNISLTQNIKIDSISSINGGIGAVNIEQDAGLVKNIDIANCFALNCGDNNSRAAFDIIGGTNITYTNCHTVNCRGIGFRSSNSPVNLVVKSSFESGSIVKNWSGTFKYLQLNGTEIIK